MEGFCADTKDVLGLDPYQLLTATALRRFWTLGFAAYALPEEQQARAQAASGTHATIGDVRRTVRRDQQRLLLAWLQEQFRAGATPDEVDDRLAA